MHMQHYQLIFRSFFLTLFKQLKNFLHKKLSSEKTFLLIITNAKTGWDQWKKKSKLLKSNNPICQINLVHLWFDLI